MTTRRRGLTSPGWLVVVSDLGPAELTSRYLIGSDGQPDGMIGEYQRILHLRVP